MSVVNSHGKKIILPRVGPNPFWERVHECRREDRRAWRRYVMLTMREGLEWPIEWIAEAFFLHKGTVSREIKRGMVELRMMMEEEG